MIPPPPPPPPPPPSGSGASPSGKRKLIRGGGLAARISNITQPQDPGGGEAQLTHLLGYGRGATGVTTYITAGSLTIG